ncbi:MAG: hypothetical protein QXR45_13850 [Candidatus Bathyarchaeia archaeon]
MLKSVLAIKRNSLETLEGYGVKVKDYTAEEIHMVAKLRHQQVNTKYIKMINRLNGHFEILNNMMMFYVKEKG